MGVKRGEIWSVAGGPDYSGKPRPALLVQNDSYADTEGVTICMFTTTKIATRVLRIEILPSNKNGLRETCQLMIDKVTTLPKTKVGKMIGRLDDSDLVRVNRALAVFLGLASSPREMSDQI